MPRATTKLLTLLVMIATTLGTGASASASVVFKTSPQSIELLSGTCAPFSGLTYYSQQTPAAGGAGIDPTVGETFYVGMTVNFFQSFECAADFWVGVLTLPEGVTPVVDATTGQIPVCIRRATGADGRAYDDPRMTANCPTSVRSDNLGISFDPVTNQLRLGPKVGATLPDIDQPTSRFFIGQRAPQENLNYTVSTVRVPVQASTAFTAPMTGFLCTTGTGCASGASVSMTVGPNTGDAVVNVSLPGDPAVSATGARIPFSADTGPGTAYHLFFDTATDAGFTTGRPCGEPYIVAPASPGPFASRVEYGDLQSGGTPCNLTPATTYFFKMCKASTGNVVDTATCRVTQFTTNGVRTVVQPPAETAADRPDSRQMVFRQHQVLGGHPAGSLFLRRNVLGSGATTDVVSSGSVGASTADSAPVAAATLSGLSEWATYEVRSCFTSGATFCGPSSRLVAGYAISAGDATAVTASTAVVGGRPSSPYPAGTLRIRAGTTDPGAADPRTALPAVQDVPLPARTDTADGPSASPTLTGLTPSTRYWWAVCFDAPGAAGDEDCSEARTFVTAAAPTPTPTPTATPTTTPAPVATPTPSPGPVIDRTRPKVSLKVTGKLRRRAKVTLKVTASDASGIRRVTIKVGKAKARAVRTLRITLPRKRGKLVIVVVVTDKAGNRTTVKRTLVVK